MSKTFTVWKGFVGVGEKCLRKENGDYVGVTSGRIYPAADHRHSERKNAQIIAADRQNLTGMAHLWTKDAGGWANRFEWKSKFIGCFVTVESAHKYQDLLVYRCRELDEYFSEKELKIL